MSPGKRDVPEITVLIADDEPLVRRRIKRLLASEPGVAVVKECENGVAAIAAVRERKPDLMFLDVQMPEIDGFGVIQALEPQQLPVVIFVTAFDHYALRAFEVHALDYLLKPFDADRFLAAFGRAREELARDQSARRGRRVLSLLDQLGRDESSAILADRAIAGDDARDDVPASTYPDRLMVKEGGSLFFIKAGDIDWIEAAGNYARLHVGREAHVIRETMHALEARLNPRQFIRIHRSTIVNLDRVKEMQPWFSGEYTVLLRDGRQLKLSRWYRERLEERMGQR